MPVNPTYPGVYVEELPSGVRTIAGVATSITAFIGRSRRGPDNRPIRIQSFGDFQRIFGGLWVSSTLGHAVQHFFQHGGSDAIIVRVHNTATPATITLTAGAGTLQLEAANPGAWGNALRVSVADNALLPATDTRYILTVQELAAPGSTTVVATETFLNISSDPANPRFITTILQQESQLIRIRTGVAVPATPPDPTDAVDPFNTLAFVNATANSGSDGNTISDTQVTNPTLAATRDGMYALDDADLFNLLYIPPLQPDADGNTDFARAAAYCQANRAVLVLDPPSTWTTIAAATAGVNALRSTIGNDSADHVAVYFPRICLRDPLRENRLMPFAPGGAVAGIMARTDAQRGVWKAPAGIDASFSGVQEFTYKMTDGENGQINQLGLNGLRSFPVYGNVVWGARTLIGADALASEWKYVPIRRTALYIEESLFRGLHWAVFEPNDESLWSQIRLNAGNFMQDLFRKGAFQGSSPRDAYLVKCDAETNPQNQIDQGIVTLLVGFAPLKPAEFVIIQIQQLAGQSGA